MVFAPMLFRDQLRPRPALILAFLFAIDPGLVALSRLAGGVVLAVAFTLFAWGMWNHRRFVLAGIFAGLALLSGTSIWMGLLGLGMAWLFVRWVERKPSHGRSSDNSLSLNPPQDLDDAIPASQSSTPGIPDPPAGFGADRYLDPGWNTFLHGSQWAKRLGRIPARLSQWMDNTRPG